MGCTPLLGCEECITEPLLKKADGTPETNKTRHSVFADDLAGGGTIDQLKRWWDLKFIWTFSSEFFADYYNFLTNIRKTMFPLYFEKYSSL